MTNTRSVIILLLLYMYNDNDKGSAVRHNIRDTFCLIQNTGVDKNMDPTKKYKRRHVTYIGNDNDNEISLFRHK